MKTQTKQSATEYHPPMTGLEVHMEEEIASKACRTNAKRSQLVVYSSPQSATVRETENDRMIKEAMRLHQ